MTDDEVVALLPLPTPSTGTRRASADVAPMLGPPTYRGERQRTQHRRCFVLYCVISALGSLALIGLVAMLALNHQKISEIIENTHMITTELHAKQEEYFGTIDLVMDRVRSLAVDEQLAAQIEGAFRNITRKVMNVVQQVQEDMGKDGLKVTMTLSL